MIVEIMITYTIIVIMLWIAVLFFSYAERQKGIKDLGENLKNYPLKIRIFLIFASWVLAIEIPVIGFGLILMVWGFR